MFTRILRVTLMGAFILPLIQAQTDSGRMIGTITDPTSAVIPGAAVTVKNEKTGDTRKAVASPNGQFLVTQLPPSQYTVTIEASGMAKAEYAGVSLQVGQERSLDAKMQPASMTTQVQV